MSKSKAQEFADYFSEAKGDFVEVGGIIKAPEGFYNRDIKVKNTKEHQDFIDFMDSINPRSLQSSGGDEIACLWVKDGQPAVEVIDHVLISKEDSIRLAHWILDMFEEPCEKEV